MNADTNFLSRLAVKIPVSETKGAVPMGTYDEILGLWLDAEDGTPLVNNPNRPRPQTKKADVETGEDNKGT